MFNLLNLEILFTKKDKLLKQFCFLTYNRYNEVHKDKNIIFDKLDYQKVKNDQIAFPIIVIINKSVVAGSVLYIKDQNSKKLLPLERDLGINLSKQKFFPKVNKYGEASKVVALSKYQTTKLLYSLYKHIIKVSHENDCYYLYAVTYKSMFRFSKIILGMLGFKCKLVKDFTVPNIKLYGNLDMVLGEMSLKKKRQ